MKKRLLALCLVLCMVLGMLPMTALAAEQSATITFDDTAKRTVITTEQQVWEENGITVTNDKGTAKSDINEKYYNPIRLYASTIVTIAYTENISKIEITTSYAATYAQPIVDSLDVTVATATIGDDGVVTIVPVGETNSISFTCAKQTRFSSLTVYYGEAEGGETEEPETPTEPETPEEDYVLTVEEAIALGETYTKNTYTTDKYYVTGVITNVYSTTYGNMYIADENGNELCIYGTYSADGSIRYDKLETKPIAGDTVTVYGIIGYYSAAQMKNGWIVEHTPAPCTHEWVDATCTDPKTCTLCGATEGSALGHTYVLDLFNYGSELTCSVCDLSVTYTALDEAVAIAEAGDHNVYSGTYLITGTITDVYNTIYGNMYITDGTNTLTIYGLYDLNNTRYDKMEDQPVAGDVVYLIGSLGNYSGKAQMKNATLGAKCHEYDDNCDWDCNICGEYRNAPHTLTTYTEEVIPANCQETGHPGYWTCADCGGYFKNEDGTGPLNPDYMYYQGEHVRPEGTPDCAIVKCELCGQDSYGTGICVAPEGTPECQDSTCVNCGGAINGWDHAYAEGLPKCQPGDCIYCGEHLEKIYDCENNIYATCAYDGECIYGCGNVYPATGEHAIDDPCQGGTCWMCWKEIAPAHEYFYPCDAYCMNCGELTNENATHNVEHVDAVEATCVQFGNLEYWYCVDCGAAWLDAEQKQLTNQMSVKLGYGDHGYYYACDAHCMYCGELTNENASHTVEHVAETCYNYEYWTCSDCGSCWSNEELTYVTNARNVVKAEPSHNLTHVEEDCWVNEHWYCDICWTYWSDEALTQITNSKNVMKAVPHNVEYVAESCYNDAHWYCADCGGCWLDEALTQITSVPSVTKNPAAHNVEHVAESCYNTEYWYCSACESYWANEELTYVTNSKNVIKAEPSHNLTHVEEDCWVNEHWYCDICWTYWSDEALTQITNSKNVMKAVPHNVEYVAESCYNDAHWYCADCGGCWLDEALTQITSVPSVTKNPAAHNVEHVAESCYNTEYWYCSACESYWANEELTYVTNSKNVIKAEPSHNLTHVEEDCWVNEHWYCDICWTYWSDEALTQITNSKNVMKAEPHTVEHVEAKEATCTEMGNIEYWYCTVCGQAWTDEAQTQVTNLMSVKTFKDHEYYYACDAFCMNCYEMTNPDAAHSLVYVPAKAGTDCQTWDGNIEYWTCEHCHGCWDNENAFGMPLNMMMIRVPGGHNYVDGACSVCGDVLTSVAVNGLNLRLQDLLKLGFYFEVNSSEEVLNVGALLWTAEQYANETDFTVNATLAKKFSGLKEVGGAYSVETDGIYAQYLDTVYYVIPYAETASGIVYGAAQNASALTYAEHVYDNDYSADLKSLVIDLVNYATAARTYFGYEEGIAAPEQAFNSFLSEADKVVDWNESMTAGVKKIAEDDTAFNPAVYGVNVNLLKAIALNMMFVDGEGVEGMLYWTAADYAAGAPATGDLSVKDGGAAVYGSVALYAYQMYNDIYFRAYDAEGNLSDTYCVSVAAYLTTVANQYADATSAEEVALLNMVKAMMVYGTNAKSNPEINKG